MGFSLSWLAVKGKEPAEVHQQFELSSTGQFGDYADYPLVGRLLPSGWYLIVADRCDHKLISDAVLTKNSLDSAIVACSIEEHVMFFSAAFWENGEKKWSITHRDGDYGIMDLVVDGVPPDPFNELRETCFAKQATEGESEDDFVTDYLCEIPLELAKSIVGFRHDEKTLGVDDGSFEILRLNKRHHTVSLGKTWWRFW